MISHSHAVSWWDIFVMTLSLLCQWYLTKLVGEIFLWNKYSSDKSDVSDTSDEVIRVILFIDRLASPLPFHQLVIASPLTDPRLLSIERRAGAAFARQFLIRSSLQCCSDRGQGWYFDHCWWSAGCLPPILAETPPTRWGRTCNLQPYQDTKYPTKRTFKKYPSKKTSSWLLFPVYVIKKWNTQNMEMEMYWWLAARCLHPPGTSWGRACNLQLYRETNEINKPMNQWNDWSISPLLSSLWQRHHPPPTRWGIRACNLQPYQEKFSPPLLYDSWNEWMNEWMN